MANKVVRVNDYLKTDNGFAHDVVRLEAKEKEKKSKGKKGKEEDDK